MRKAVVFRALAVCLAVCWGTFSCPAGTKILETDLPLDSAKSQGHEQRDIVNSAHVLIKERKYAEADKKLDQVLDYFGDIIRKGEKSAQYLCFQTKEEFAAFQKQSKKKVVWLDECYGRAYHFKAFICINKRDLKQAREYLLREMAVAPCEAMPYSEMGFISNQLKKSKEALSFYQKALEMTKTYKSQKALTPLVLRGIGFTLIDLGRLDEAEKSFNESLKIEPDNKLAKSELKYIKAVRKKQAEQAEKKRKGKDGTK